MFTIHSHCLNRAGRLRQDPRRIPPGNHVAVICAPPRAFHQDHAPLLHLCHEVGRTIGHEPMPNPQARQEGREGTPPRHQAHAR